MKQVFTSIFFLCFGLVFYGQELETEGHAIPAEKSKIEAEVPLFHSMDLLSSTARMGPFQVDRYKIHINLIDISFPSNQEIPIDILAMARAEEHRKKSQTRDFKAPIRQLEQIRSEVQVFEFQIDLGRSTNNLQYNSKNTPDGGIRNEAFQEIRQPFLNTNPHYNRSGRTGYYNNSYFGRPTSLYYRR